MSFDKNDRARRLHRAGWLGLSVILILNGLAQKVLHQPTAQMLSDGWWNYWFPAYALFLVVLMATSVRMLISATGGQSKYVAWFSLGMIGYGVSVPVTISFAKTHPDSPLLVLIVALLPIAATGFMITAFLIALSRMDELMRLMHLRAMAIAFGLTGFGTFGYAWLERAGLPALDTMLIFPASLLVWGLALTFQRAVYR